MTEILCTVHVKIASPTWHRPPQRHGGQATPLRSNKSGFSTRDPTLNYDYSRSTKAITMNKVSLDAESCPL